MVNSGQSNPKVKLHYLESPLALTRIFLTGCPPIPDMIYVNENCYLQAIKIPPNLKQVWRVLVKSFGHSNTAHQIAVFFIWWTYLHLIK